MRLPFRLRHFVFGALSLAALAAVATTPQLLGHQMRDVQTTPPASVLEACSAENFW